MKCLGLIGNLNDALIGLYTTTINAEVRKALGGHHSANLCVKCVDSAPIEARLVHEDWRAVSRQLRAAARSFRRDQVDGLVICGCSLDPVAAEVAFASGLPVIRVGKSMALKLRQFPVERVCVLGIRTPREARMWAGELAGLSLLQPDPSECRWLNDRTDDVLSGHPISPLWPTEVTRVIAAQRRNGAQAIVLAAHPLAQLLRPADCPVPIFDAAEIHAWAAGVWSVTDDFLPALGCWIGA